LVGTRLTCFYFGAILVWELFGLKRGKMILLVHRQQKKRVPGEREKGLKEEKEGYY
jgi:hypothetical protein